MTLHAIAPNNTWVPGLVYDDEEHLLNLFFEDSTGLGRAKRAMGEIAPETEGPQPVGVHEAYHKDLATALSEAGAPEDLLKEVRRMGNGHGHFQLSHDLAKNRRGAIAKLQAAKAMSKELAIEIAKKM